MMPINLFPQLLAACGLDHATTAALFGVRLDTVRSWSSGRRKPPPAVMSGLADLEGRIKAATAEAIATLEHAPPGKGLVELGICVDDHEARGLGWPSVGVHLKVVAGVAAECIRGGLSVSLVHRGTTQASTLASDQAESID